MMWRHSGTPAKPGAARHRLFNARAGTTAESSGTVTLSSSERKDLREGRILIRFYPIAHGESVTVQLPETRAWQ